MKQKTDEEEALRRQAFLEYQKTGQLNDVVKQEIEAYVKRENRWYRRLVIASAVIVLLAYVIVLGLSCYQYQRTGSKGFGILSVLLFLNFIVALCIWSKRRKKKKAGK